jgi:ribose transport system permease protein
MIQPRRLDDVTVQVLILCLTLIVLVSATGLVNTNFFRPITVHGVIRDTAILGLLALGQAVVILSGGIDLSVGSVLGFAGVVGLWLANQSQDISILAIAGAVVLLGVAIGLAHGLLICLLNLQPFLVTLCSLLIFRGFSRALTGDRVVSFDPEAHPALAWLGQGSWFGLPIPAYVLLAVLAALGFFLQFTVPGRYLFALGANAEAARFSGVSVNRLRLVSYGLCSVITAVAALLEAGSIGSVTPSTAGNTYEMYAITAAVLGGCSLRGGKGSLIGAIVGAAVLRVLRSSVIFLDISTYWTLAVTGLVLLGAVVTDALVRLRRPS